MMDQWLENVVLRRVIATAVTAGVSWLAVHAPYVHIDSLAAQAACQTVVAGALSFVHRRLIQKYPDLGKWL